tara:strand:+ start:18662 stop:19375 length:714 start_codon:yes stop_codon:yes gene_type:complete
MINNYFITNIYEKQNTRSKISSQLLYGEKFNIISSKRGWYKVRTSYDKYLGYVKKRKFKKILKITHKVYSLKAILYSKPNSKFKTKKTLSFCSLISVVGKKFNFYKIDKYWIKKKDVVPIKFKEKLFKRVKMFVNVKYKWGGKSFHGIDCSALVQLFFKFNNLYCPRDTKDQLNYFKKKNELKKNTLIFWKGHVALCVSKNRLIHAYGPKKKVLIMNTNKTIDLIEKTANLKVIGLG